MDPAPRQPCPVIFVAWAGRGVAGRVTAPRAGMAVESSPAVRYTTSGSHDTPAMVARYAVLFAACVVAGAINAVAGGGSLLSFPAAMAIGMVPLVANATNTVAMTPGSLAAAWAWRHELSRHRRLALAMIPSAVAGSLVGAQVLVHTPQRVFDAVVPWLVLGATLLLLAGDRLGAMARRARGGRASPLWLAAVLQFIVAVYGGYFGAGMGILMLALLALPGDLDLHELNAVKTLLSACINGVASVFFVALGVVHGRDAALMAAGAIVGGYLGASAARRVAPGTVRWIVVVIGFGLTLSLLVRRR